MIRVVVAAKNLTEVVVRVVHQSKHPRLEGWGELEVDVIDATPVEGHADLLSSRLGQHILMAVPPEIAASLSPGSMLTCRVKLHAGEVMAEPHPRPGSYSVQPREPLA